MAKKPRAYHRPADVDEALRLLGEPDTVPLAGGSKLLAGDIRSAVVDLQDLGLDDMALSGGRLAVGATARLTDLIGFLRGAPEGGPGALLLPALHRAGPNTYRNVATLGGSIASRLPDSELLAALLALEARLVLASGEKPSLPAYWDGPDPGLILACDVPWSSGRAALERVARTPADDPIVAVAGWRPDAGDWRLAATGVDALPIRLAAAEDALRTGDLEGAVNAARAACRHAGDFRGSAAYRRDMVGVLLRRAVS